MNRKSVTISDVAEVAGVSKMTVSNVLSNDAARRRHVSEQTRERVLEAVRKMKYRPNVNALSLRRRRTNIVGFYAGHGYMNPENAFLAAIIGGLQEGCDLHKKDLLLHGTFRGQSIADIYAELVDGRIDGLVLYSPDNDPLVKLLADSHLPVIALADTLEALPTVVVDDTTGGQMQAEFLAARGYRRIAYHSQAYPVFVSATRRWQAFYEAACAQGLAVREYPGAAVRNEPHITAAETAWLRLPAEERPEAAVCWNDVAAYDFLALCQQQGLQVPADVAVVGFDGVVPTRGVGRQITTVRAPWPQVGRTAVELLVQTLEGEEIPHETILPVEWIEGETA